MSYRTVYRRSITSEVIQESYGNCRQARQEGFEHYSRKSQVVASAK